MKYLFTIFFFLLLTLWSCQSIEDAEFADRKTFIHLYEGLSPFTAAAAEEIPDGYVILGNTSNEGSETTMIITTDRMGNQTNQYSYPGETGKALAVLRDPSGNVSGYIIAGDSIKITPDADPAANAEIYSIRLLRVSNTGLIVNQIDITDNDPDHIVKTDFKASAVTVNGQSQVILLGTYKSQILSPEKPFVVSLSEDLNTINWTKNYDVIERNFINGKSLHYNNGMIIWASAILKPQGTFNDSYLAIPYIEEGSVFANNDLYKENESQLLIAGDIQPAASPAFGYGFVGTYSSTAGSQANILFMRVNTQGKIIAGSQRYFDGGSILESNTALSSETTSQTEDSGVALSATRDGGFILAASMLSTPGLGNGLRDILLIKVDGLGNPVWNKLIGGSGDELVSTIRETEDGGFLICGTSTISGFSNIFLIKTDEFGELKK